MHNKNPMKCIIVDRMGVRGCCDVISYNVTPRCHNLFQKRHMHRIDINGRPAIFCFAKFSKAILTTDYQAL